MRNVEEYLKLPYRMEIIPDADEGGFAVTFPDLPGCLTCAETMEKAIAKSSICDEWFLVDKQTYLEICEKKFNWFWTVR